MPANYAGAHPKAVLLAISPLATVNSAIWPCEPRLQRLGKLIAAEETSHKCILFVTTIQRGGMKGKDCWSEAGEGSWRFKKILTS